MYNTISHDSHNGHSANRGRGRGGTTTRRAREAKLRIHLRKFSTREAHPLAVTSIVPVEIIPNETESMNAKIAIQGSLLFLLYSAQTNSMILRVYNWMTGQCLLVSGRCILVRYFDAFR